MIRSLLMLFVFIIAAGVHHYIFGNSHPLKVGVYNGALFALGGLFWSFRND